MEADYLTKEELELELEMNSEKEFARSEWDERGLRGKIRMQSVAVGDVYGKQLRFEFTIPNAERIVLPDDLGVLVQLFAWTITGLEVDLRCGERSFLSRSWHVISLGLRCKRFLNRMRDCFHLDYFRD